MRIVLDMQGAQSESRYRGIGRYTLSFAQAIVKRRGEHEVILAMSGLLPDSIREIRNAFEGLLPQENIKVWYAPGPVCALDNTNQDRQHNAELIRETFLASLQPDIIHVFSMFEGYVDDAVTSIGRFDSGILVSATIFDLIPLLNPEKYLHPDPAYASYYNNKLAHLQKAHLLVAISESSKNEAHQHLPSYTGEIVNCYLAADEIFKPQNYSELHSNNLKQYFGIDKHFVLYTGGADDRKNLPRLIQAYALLPEDLRSAYQLVFAGRMPTGNKQQLIKLAKESGLKKNELIFTGYVSDEQLCQFYNLCALFVFPSIHEGFGLPALEAMNCNAGVIAANTSSLPEVIGMDEALFNPRDVSAISHKIEQGLRNPDLIQKLRSNTQSQAHKFTWEVSTDSLYKAWELLAETSALSTHEARITNNEQDVGVNTLLTALHEQAFKLSKDRLTLAHFLAKSFPDPNRKKQILIDVSELALRDSKSGVQRVVKNILLVWLNNPPEGWAVKPVYGQQHEPGYFYANEFTQRFLGINEADSEDQIAEAWSGDIFLILDLQHHVLQAQEKTLQNWRDQGVVVKTVIYDLLPILLPDYFMEGAQALHRHWLALTSRFDGVICISESVAGEYQNWLKINKLVTSKTFSIDWFHLGADIIHDVASQGLPKHANEVIEQISSGTSFLMVGTLEPRKGHAQTLQAFEELWQKGLDYKLVIAGKQGWMIDHLADKIRTHPQLNKNLYWLEGISDEFLEQLYSKSHCLIAASYGEGFGLPLIEAAQHKISIIARDIPVFREVAGKHAFYFDTKAPSELADALQQWEVLYKRNSHPRSDNMPWLKWSQSAHDLTSKLIGSGK